MSERMAWSKFSWDAWENDPGLALCSMGAQGFWMRLLCIAAKADGHVLVGDHIPTTAELAMLVRAPEADVAQWLRELEAKGVFSRTAKGTIYSRRMVRNFKNRQNGKLGGNPDLLISQENLFPVNAETETESETETETETETESEREPDGSDEFETAWKAFPQTGRGRSGREQARKAWNVAARKAGGGGHLQRCVEAYADSEDARREGGKYVPGFHRWLRNGLWEHWKPDGPELRSEILAFPADPWRFRCQTFLKNDSWYEDWGPRPGREGCECPPELLAEFDIAKGHPDLLRRRALHASGFKP